MIDWPQHMLAKAIDRHNLTILRRTWDMVPDQLSFFERYLAVANHPDSEKANVFDAFSQGQLDSKMWLIREVKRLGLNLGNVWTLCGWVGTMAYLMFTNGDGIGVSDVRSFDVDPNCADIAEMLNRDFLHSGWRFKAFTMDVNDLNYDGFSWTFWSKVNNRMSYPIVDVPDTIINTSCDHMGESSTWWDNIPVGRLVILQNNNFLDVDEHDNTVGSLAEFADMYPMGQMLFSGELDCKLYKRFMLIGRK